jgi:hypothetical protein
LTEEDVKKNMFTRNNNSDISEEYSDDDYETKNHFFVTR